MRVSYQNKRLEKATVIVNTLTSLLVAVSFALLFGFDEPYIPAPILYVTQAVLLCIFVAEKVVRFFNARLKSEYLRVFWFQIPLLAALILFLVGAGRWFAEDEPAVIRYAVVGIYLVTQVVIKVCRSVVNLAATGRNPTTTLILSFVVLIVTGAILLSLPKSTPPGAGSIGLVNALFTSTSATCVTGLIVKDTGTDFSLMGQVVILSLIQLGGLGIVVFGAVFALLLGQALTVRESVAMQDLLSVPDGSTASFTPSAHFATRALASLVTASSATAVAGRFTLLSAH
jgi:trk system potassium uptake protein TrkH